MKDKVVLVEMLFDKIEKLSKTSFELYKLKAIDKVTDVFSSIASGIVIIVFIALFFILLTLGLALQLGELLGKSYYGFYAIAGLYALIAVLLLIFRKNVLEEGFNNYIINQIFKDKKNAGN